MEKKITFLHEELKSKNTIITLLLENVVKLREKKTLNQLNQLKQWKEKSCQQNH